MRKGKWSNKRHKDSEIYGRLFAFTRHYYPSSVQWDKVIVLDTFYHTALMCPRIKIRSSGGKMKTIQNLFLALVLLCGAAVLSAQTPDWSWAVGAGGTDMDSGLSIATDSQGNQYVTGGFADTATFGSHTLTASGGNDIFVAKLDPSGNWIWAVKAGGIGYDRGNNITLDSTGNAYVTGYFADTATFGSHTLTAGGTTYNTNIFVAKLDPNGNWLQAVQAEGASSGSGTDIVLDIAGNAYVTGTFYGTATFGSHTLTADGSGYGDIFVAKLNASGNWLWAVKAGGTGGDEGRGIALDGADNTYVTGSFRGTATFGNYTFTATGLDDLFVAKLNPSGNWIWAVRAGASDDEHVMGNGIAVDGAGNAYVTGKFGGTTTFGSHTLTADGLNIFATKLDPSGNWIWAVKAGGTGWDLGNGIAVDGAGNAWVTGCFEGIATFGSHILTASGGEWDTDVFAAKLDPSGNWIWAVKAGGTEWDRGNGIAVDGAGNTYLTGEFQDTATFGSHTLTSNGFYDIFVVRIGATTSAGIPIAPENLSISTNGTDILLDWDDVTVDTAGNQVSVDHYLVYYCSTGPEGPFTIFGEDSSITQPQWTHSGAASLSPGFYYVTAVVAD
mgnify:CR=1 FL=1|jgi:hypothetical protein